MFAYKINRTAKYDTTHLSILKANPVKHHDDWSNSCYQPIKEFIKKAYYPQQNRRCAYCRKRLNADAYYSHLDHIIPKSVQKRWMFVPNNLAITCEVCNPLKNADDTLSPGTSKSTFPNSKAGFTIFNPHFEKWEDCFEIEDGMFIRGKNKRGEETIKVCKLHQYHFSVQFSVESDVKSKTAIKRAVIRQRNFQKGTVEHESATKIIEYYKSLI